MAGITATALSTSLTAANTAVDKQVSGFVTGEKITLGLTTEGTARTWSLGIPAGSASAKSALSSTTSATPNFTPDVDGYYVLTCIVDGATTYILRIAVADAATVLVRDAINLIPVADSTVPTPQTGVTLYYSSDQSALAIKDTAGAVSTVDITGV